MTKREPRKSIIANFGSLLSNQPGSSAGSTDDSSVGGRTVARVGAGVIGATQRTLTDIREERDRLRVQLESGSGLEVDPDLIEPSPFPDRLPDDSVEDFETFKRQIEDEGQKIPIQVRPPPRLLRALSGSLWSQALAGRQRTRPSPQMYDRGLFGQRTCCRAGDRECGATGFDVD